MYAPSLTINLQNLYANSTFQLRSQIIARQRKLVQVVNYININLKLYYIMKKGYYHYYYYYILEDKEFAIQDFSNKLDIIKQNM